MADSNESQRGTASVRPVIRTGHDQCHLCVPDGCSGDRQVAECDAERNTVNYAYDSLGRLTSATSAAWNQSYTYDGFSNLYQKTGSTGTMNWSALLNSEKNQIGSYDAAGNSVGYTWDADNRLIGIPSWSRDYVYDSSNQRVIEFKQREHYDPDAVDTYVVTFRVGGTVLGRYEYSGTATPVMTTWREFQYLGGRRTDIGADGLGSNLKGGRVILPYGEELSPTPDGETKFATYWRDAVTGLDYADQRYYSPGTGRFLSADPYMASGGAGNPSSWNRYTYVEGDPVNSVDPSGLIAARVVCTADLSSEDCLEPGFGQPSTGTGVAACIVTRRSCLSSRLQPSAALGRTQHSLVPLLSPLRRQTTMTRRSRNVLHSLSIVPSVIREPN